MLDVKRLQVFREVARQGSFSAAADALDYSQPAISHHVSRLEMEVGARLLERRQRGVELTDAGRVLLNHAEALLRRMRDAEAELAEVIQAGRSSVRLAAFSTASATIVPDAIAEFRRADPHVGFTLVEGEAADTIEMLRARHVDIAIVFDDPDHPVAADEEIELHYVYNDPMLIALPRRHPLARREVIDLAELDDADWIEGAGKDTPCSLILMTACTAVGFRPRISFNSGNYGVVLRLVAAGVGVALVPELAITGADPGVVIRPLERPNPYRRVGVALLRDVFRPPAHRRMLDVIQSVCDGYAAHQPLRDVPAVGAG